MESNQSPAQVEQGPSYHNSPQDLDDLHNLSDSDLYLPGINLGRDIDDLLDDITKVANDDVMNVANNDVINEANNYVIDDENSSGLMTNEDPLLSRAQPAFATFESAPVKNYPVNLATLSPSSSVSSQFSDQEMAYPQWEPQGGVGYFSVNSINPATVSPSSSESSWTSDQAIAHPEMASMSVTFEGPTFEMVCEEIENRSRMDEMSRMAAVKAIPRKPQNLASEFYQSQAAKLYPDIRPHVLPVEGEDQMEPQVNSISLASLTRRRVVARPEMASTSVQLQSRQLPVAQMNYHERPPKAIQIRKWTKMGHRAKGEEIPQPDIRSQDESANSEGFELDWEALGPQSLDDYYPAELEGQSNIEEMKMVYGIGAPIDFDGGRRADIIADGSRVENISRAPRFRSLKNERSGIEPDRDSDSFAVSTRSTQNPTPFWKKLCYFLCIAVPFIAVIFSRFYL